jgi:hypothetical protein
MSNTIDFPLGADNNMETLMFFWTAIFKDGSFISQFDSKTNQENLFGLVRDRFSELDCFILKHRSKDIQFKVDLAKGVISYGKNQEITPEFIKERDNLRLIYFRRVRKEIGEHDFIVKLVSITFFLGFQYNDAAGHNRQIVLKIDGDGNWILGE